MGSCCSTREDDSQEGFNSIPITQDTIAEELPPGWKMVPSRSRPGKVSYQNIHTGERISWIPKEEAKTYKGAITKNRRKKKKDSEGNAPAADSAKAGDRKENGNETHTSDQSASKSTGIIQS